MRHQCCTLTHNTLIASITTCCRLVRGHLVTAATLGWRARHSVRAANVQNQSDLGCFRVTAGAHGVTRPTHAAGDRMAAVLRFTRSGLLFAAELEWGESDFPLVANVAAPEDGRTGQAGLGGAGTRKIRPCLCLGRMDID